MKLGTFVRYILLPTAALAVGVKAGIEYAKSTYVSRDRKFIEGEIVEEKK